ncbi:uncharacterized protein LOC116205155 [Punica granatum]|uniref:Uncharacterized protein LOC116205155 n=2 Tax=Punica granatum TaxID=22663 RepID=A0A6P8DJH9_PUNGR|nr:uncharacterized protein LOC116205155 [Punica granatum]PKI58055.1 hypothetical protein CRG98_021548 [Punica granatum]
MLLAVEGGGFFSSSASGYSKGLTLLLLGQKDEDDKPMRVSPWNQYHLVNQEPDVRGHLGSRRKWHSRAWVSFMCFHGASGAADGPSYPNVGGDHQEIWPGPLVSNKCKDSKTDLDDVIDAKVDTPRSNLRRRSSSVAVSVLDAHECNSLVENIGNIPGQIGGRRVQWTDALGTELAEIREFEPSEIGGSDDEAESKNEGRCTCTIM